MNKDKNINEYLEKWRGLTLSDSVRTKMEETLRDYASFHPVRVEEPGRFITQVPFGASLLRLKFTTMPIAILLAVFLSAGTSFAAQSALPGDILYPVKTEVNENIRSAFTFGADAQATFEADLLEERLAEAKELQTEGKLSGEVAARVAAAIKTQAESTESANDDSSADVTVATDARVKVALQDFISLVGINSAIATDISTQFSASTLSKGTISIEAFTADIKARIASLRSVVAKHQTEMKATVKAELTAKLDTAAALTVQAATMSEAEARSTLTKAATLTGEVEATLSTLGQATVDTNTGIITDIDFSIVPTKLNIRSDGSVDTSATGSAGSKDGVDATGGIKTNVNLDTDTDVNLDANDTAVDSGIKATSGLGL